MGTPTTAFLLSAAAASTTMLGWVAVAARHTWTPRHNGMALLGSAVAMLVISLVELLPPGLRDPATRVPSLALLATGALLVPLLATALERAVPSMDRLGSASILVMLSIGVHNLPEGTVVFAATMVSLHAGVVTALAIALHNVPEGMAVATAVIAAGGTRRRALAFTAVTMLGEVLGAAVMLLLGTSLSATGATMLLSLVAGIMVSLSVTQLIPSALAMMRAPDRTDLDSPARSTPSVP